MKLILKSQYEQLLKNGANRGGDHIPVVKLFTPSANATWLLTELDPEEPRIAFGLCDLGLGYPEMGYVSLDEIEEISKAFVLPVERDLHFKGKYPLSVYARAASKASCITECTSDLEGAL